MKKEKNNTNNNDLNNLISRTNRLVKVLFFLLFV